MTEKSPEYPDVGREHIEVLKETIDRNIDADWSDYRDRYRFTLVDDGRVRISRRHDGEEPRNAVETGVAHVVQLEGGEPVSCNCHSAQRYLGRETCRHMRAVAAHPRL